MASTWYAVTQYGIDSEANWLVRDAMEFYGLNATLIVIFVLHGMLTVSLYAKESIKAMWIILAVLTYIDVNNVYWILSHV